jgi:glycosyltransferase involved in cell wall biosynthesis
MGVRFGVLSTYPPTQCGIATFTQALVSHLHTNGTQAGVVRIVDELEQPESSVAHQWVLGTPWAISDAARALDRYDVALIQHEYGIFGGQDGREVLDVIARLHVPVVTVLHTVLTDPTPHQHEVLAGICDASSLLVTMTETARQRLLAGWDVPADRVVVIAHGAESNLTLTTKRHTLSNPPTVLTWGLLGEGKGIEWALRALAELGDVDPFPEYFVVGQTHPRVLERDGDVYRAKLVALTEELGLSSSVHFVGTYLPGDDLRRIVREADVILLPYDSREQVTSGVLTEAVAAGKPVVSTSFPHAVELLSGGAGLLVPQRDPAAIATALRRVLTEPGLADRMAATSRGLASALLWPEVARQYTVLGRRALMASPSIDLSDPALAIVPRTRAIA